MFKTMTGCLDLRKTASAEDIQKIPSYIFCRWLSGNPHAISAANLINKYDKIPIDNQYKMIRAAFGGKIKFIPYPKNTSVDDLKQTQYIAEHFKISPEKAKEYVELMSEQELRRICEMYEEHELKS